MRHVMLLTSSLFIGGAERVIANLARHIDRSTFRVTIAHLKRRGDVGDELAAEGHEVVGIPRSERGLGKYLSFRSLHRVVRERRVDVLHTHTTYSLTDGALCRLASVGRTKLVHTFHFGNYPHMPAKYRAMERFGTRVANHVVSVGVEQGRILRSLYRIPDGRLSAILNGTDHPSPAPEPSWTARLEADGRVVIGTTATFIEQKGLDYLIQVARMLKRDGVPAVFLLVGDGHLRGALQTEVAAAQVEDTVLFAGWQPRADATMTPLYDVLLQPSRWEAMSVVVLEAMAASKPAVVTDVGDNRHVVVEGETGFVVPPHDVVAMADRLKRLVGSPALRERFGRAGRRRYEEQYTAPVMARQYEAVYARVLGDM